MAKTIASVRLPAGFDPAKHATAFMEQLCATSGEDWVLSHFELDSMLAHVHLAQHLSDNRKRLHLDPGTKSTDAPKVIGRLEAQNPGWKVTDFDTPRQQVTLERMDEDTVRARQALATAMGAKPWEVSCSPRKGGGYMIKVPPSYAPSKHDKKIAEAACTIGDVGWFVKLDPMTLRGEFVPADLPTFKPSYVYPLGSGFRAQDIWSLPFGMRLGHRDVPESEVSIDLESSAGILMVGTPNSGKSVAVNAIINSAMERGWQLAVGDTFIKSVDYDWCKDMVRPHGFGCETHMHTLAMLELVYEEAIKRSSLLRTHGVQKIADLPIEVMPEPILLVMDEVQQLFMLKDVPKGIDKDHPLKLAALEHNLIVNTMMDKFQRIMAELRFTGVRGILATQMAQNNTGITIPMKMTMANRVLMGASPGMTARNHAFTKPRSMPEVPDNIAQDPEASLGVGVAELEGQPPCVVKGYFTTPDTYRQHLLGHGVRTTDRPVPTTALISRYHPMEETVDTGPPPSRFDEVRPDDTDLAEPKLTGAAKASHQLAVEAARHANNKGGPIE